MKDYTVKCKVCLKNIRVTQEKYGSSKWSTGSNKGKFVITSEEGVCFFLSGSIKPWFCNKCWELIRE